MEHLHSTGKKPYRNGNLRAYSGFSVPSSATEQEETYYAALKLVAQIDEDLTRGVRHYRNKAGLLLTTLDEVVQAILDDDLLLEEEMERDSLWYTPQELAA